jgi:hypothetical protein
MSVAIPQDLREACYNVFNELRDSKSSTSRIAVTYALGMDQAAAFGMEGLGSQCLYILNNVGGWRGPVARASKKIFHKYAKLA